MTVKDFFLALFVVVVWGVNFVVIKVGVSEVPPFLLGALRFSLVAIPAIFFVKRPNVPLRWLLCYGLTISFGQFAFLFFAIKSGMPAGIASLVLQAQAFFTILLGALFLSESLKWHHIVGIIVASTGMYFLAGTEGSSDVAVGLSFTTMLLTLAGAFCWSLGNISNKVIMRNNNVPVLSLVVWSALIPVLPFLVFSWFFEGKEAIVYSLQNIRFQSVFSIFYLAFVATIMGYGIWGYLLGRYETWRVAPLSLLVPVVGMISAAVLLGETLNAQQVFGAVVVIVGLLLTVFGGSLKRLQRG
ncbi:acetylserine transporter [Enterovibrio norvegicus FF-33]|uniref:Acetylserine transporter n=2 Tax=Enterovibrio TaxID=188143 RepID=A0A1E5CC69_9GAMM|nr:EamA family transporter [Enterovibrio norvegicus]OEE63079.1 acetylserine transporter [Enterovibrio norvegicus FF-454]OEE67002.1 acetylserine transporter [Enterovibrio norvegicus FF-33]OEE74703.1 acetylserine transporter [Enterovibrio norvegicus FF-162]